MKNTYSILNNFEMFNSNNLFLSNIHMSSIFDSNINLINSNLKFHGFS